MRKAALLLLFALISIPSLTRAQGSPACGLSNNQNPYIPGTYPSGTSNWDTFVPPAVGGSYVDTLSGCTFTRITDSVADGVGHTIYYSSVSPFNANDTFLMIYHVIKTGPAYSSAKPGSTVVPSSNIPGYDGDPPIWDGTNPNVFYYASGNSLKSGTITGLPGCITTQNCTVTVATVHTFSSYSAIAINDEPDLSQDKSSLLLVGSSGGPIDIFTWNLNTSTQTIWYTTVSCTGSVGVQSGSGGCMHKVQLSPKNEPIVTWNNGGTGSEQGIIWYHGTPGSATQTHLVLGSTPHMDTGLDMIGNPVYIIDGWPTGTGDPCPGNQWPGQSGGGGQALTLFSNPVPSASICDFNKDWAATHISYRGGPSQPWISTSFADVKSTSAEWFTTSGGYLAPTCTQTHPTDSGSCWYPYQDEIVLTKVSTNMTIAGIAPLATVYRMGWGRSRTHENFWAQNTASLSHDGNYIALNSNMAHVSGCTSAIQGANGCADVYVISAANGAPLFGTGSSGTGPAPPTGLTAVVQ